MDEEDYLNSVTNVTVRLKSINQEVNKSDYEKIEAVSLVSINTTAQGVHTITDQTKNEELSHYFATQWSIPIEKIEVVMEGGR
ncbi:hypothetical protein KHA80_02795 [Anaerobacillus sp. HL2]|nr:hypothetical protein KHA80_02795 [Anaerobacillus sp. HL2]